MSWDNLKELLSEDVELLIKEVGQLEEANIEKTLNVFRQFLVKELKKPAEERDFYEDENGANIVVVRFPKKEYVDRGIAKDPSVTKKGGWYWWGPQTPLMNNEGNPIITMFLPGDWNPDAMWEPKDKKQLIIFRGIMKKEYNWIDDPPKTNARNETKFVKEAIKRFKDPEIESIKDIDPTEIDRIKYTFNAEQKLKVL